ncbi:MAG: hypothetical protein A2075_12815 [Geobacteraceae bacterium GWC2_58_44]|nr:MAG: hypothetical protein A2075_12815 [Geobacteraceae bacterium GWC2_58_44]HBG05618.1 hypothetical protein [Geobacter sp.]
MFVIASSLYYIAIPVEMYLMKADDYSAAGMYVELVDNSKLYLIINGTLSIASFLVGYRLSGFRLNPESDFVLRERSSVNGFSSFEVSVHTIIFLSALILLTFFRSELSTSMSGYESNYGNIYSNPSYSYLIYVFTVSLSVAAFLKLCVYNKILDGVIMICIGVSLGILTSDKNPMLISLLPLAAKLSSFQAKSKYSTIFSLISIVIGITVTLVLIPAFSLYRAGLNLFSLDIFDHYYFSFTRIDPSGPFISLSETLNKQPPLSLGVQYLKNISIIIPKSLWPSRPIDLGEQFARDFMQQWAPGRGFGYSLMAEGLVNFGRYFCFLHYIIVGLFWGLCWRCIAGVLKNQLYVNAVYRTLGFYIIILMHRSSSLSTIKTMLHFFVPLFVVIALIRMVKPILRTVLSAKKPQHAI